MYYKAFYGRNLGIFVIARMFDPGKPFQPNLMFVGRPGAYTNEAPFRCPTLG